MRESSFKLYLQSIGNYKTLTKEEEIELGKRIKEGDMSARDELITRNLKFVVFQAKKYANPNHNIPLEDLVAEGNKGLITAAEKYDYSLGYRFSTYAGWWIKQAIMKFIVDNSRMIRIPAHVIKQFNQYRDAIQELQAQGITSPTAAEIARQMKITVGKLEDLLEWRKNSTSLDLIVGEDGESTLGDFCASGDETPREYLERQLKKEFIADLIEELDDRAKKIFKLRYGLGVEGVDPDFYMEEHTLEEIGDLIEPRITRERVRQIVAEQTAKWRTLYKDQFDIQQLKTQLFDAQSDVQKTTIIPSKD